MKILIFGSGGVGGYFGSRLLSYNKEVYFIARGQHLEAIRKHGLRVISKLGNVHNEVINVSDTVSDFGIVDVVIFSVKLYDTANAVKAIKPAIGSKTLLVSFQNGISGADILVDTFGPKRVIGGSSSIATRVSEPGVIVHTGSMASLIFGEWDGGTRPLTEKFFEVCKLAKIDVELSTNINRVIWSKFVFLSAFSGITCTFRQPIGPILMDNEKRQLFQNALEETTKIALAMGIVLPSDLVNQRMTFAEGLPVDMYSSMYHDLNAGKRLELPWLSGLVVDLGQKFKINTPVHRFFVEKLSNYSSGTKN